MSTATVETLTAEVRVLMVGRRQVTLSVYRQLDRIPTHPIQLELFEPFGRVRSGAKPRLKVDTREPTEFVGRHRISGQLVRVQVDDADWYRLPAETAVVIRHWCGLPLIVLAGLR